MDACGAGTSSPPWLPTLIVTSPDVDEMCGILGESVAVAQKSLPGRAG
jgi:hypothetical protein